MLAIPQEVFFMTAEFSLARCAHVSFVPITDGAKAIAFYRDLLGLTLVEDQSPFALVFDLNGNVFRVTFVGEFTPQKFTILGWQAADIDLAVAEMTAAGVVFNKYPWMQSEGAVWTAPGGTRIAWFSDPFGNVLSLQSA
jgi:catechol 2,3-dioxygenase-like lactoylglutathione lyase family enzyme